MSEIKVNKLTPRTNCGTTTLGDSGDTINIPAGVTISNNGTATGFGATGAVNWDVASIKTVDFTAVSGVGYFVDTATTGAVEVTLPAAPAVGDVVGVSDYAKNFATANCTLNRNSLKIGGDTINAIIKTNGVAVTLVYIDATKGWIVTDSGNQSDAPTALYITATGGCITTCGNYKIHTFLSPATFTVSCAGNPGGSNIVDYLVVAGGGGGGGTLCTSAGAGGAGGFRYYANTTDNPQSGNPAVPINNFPSGTTIPVSATAYPITVGGAGSAGPDNSGPTVGGTGGVSIFSTVTSAGGGGGHGYKGATPLTGTPGGSGGGGSYGGAGGAGNDPPTSPSQGNNGGAGDTSPQRGGGGGGAMAVGETATGSQTGDGGAGGGVTGFGITGQVCGGKYYFAGGGGGGSDPPAPAGGLPGLGGGGAGGRNASGTNGLDNTGGGGGAGQSSPNSPRPGALGGSGIVIIRYKYQ